MPRVTSISEFFQVPSWKPGTNPPLTAHFTDLSHVGVKGNGEQLIFGAKGEVLKTDGDLADFGNFAVRYNGAKKRWHS